MTVVEVIARARQLTKDIDSYRWDDQEFLNELNELKVEVANELQLFKDEITINIFDGQAVYDYSEEITELIEVRSKDYDGAIILPSSLQTFRATGRTGDAGSPSVIFDQTVSYGKIRLDPTPTATERSDILHVWVP